MIRVNKRDEVAWQKGMTVSDLLERMRYSFPHIIVTIDEELIPREEYGARAIPDGADVRVVHLIAGG